MMPEPTNLKKPNVTSYCRACGKFMGGYSDFTGVAREIREHICNECRWVGVFKFPKVEEQKS